MRRLNTPAYGFAVPDAPRIRRLFERALAEPEREHPELQSAVRAFVRRARAEAAPPERVIVALKEMVGLLDQPGRSLSTQATSSVPFALVRLVVSWCIDEYFRSETDAEA